MSLLVFDQTLKKQLHEQIISTLNDVYLNALKATALAHEAATNKNNIAENKYDTLGLEAAYLAHGQSQRVLECQNDLMAFKSLNPECFTPEMPIAIGALVSLIDEAQEEKYYFVGPSAGGLKIVFKQWNILVVTTSSPIGRALLGCLIDDEVAFNVAEKVHAYSIASVN